MDAKDNDLLERYVRGLLSADDDAALRARIESDAELRQHAELLRAMQDYARHENLRSQLNRIHEEMVQNAPPAMQPKVTRWKKYLPLTAVAASVALISVTATIFIIQRESRMHETQYIQLRRNVDQINKSQKQIIADINEVKESIPLPGKYAGTGFVISSGGFVATSYHVIKEADSIVLENQKYGSLKAAIVYSDADNDISILRIISRNVPIPRALPFSIVAKKADLGTYVYTLGYPREDVVFGEGSVSALSGYRQNTNAYQVSVPVNPGNSGGPLLNERGNVIGMICGIQTHTSGASFAIKSTTLLHVLKNMPIDTATEPIRLPSGSLYGKSRIDQIKMWSELVFIVRVYNSK